MFNIKEIIIILISSLLIAFSYYLFKPSLFFTAFIFILIIYFFYVLSQKIAAYYFDVSSETKIWTEKRYWLTEKSYFKTGVPWGYILSFIFSLLSLGHFTWLALTETDLKAKKSRVARKHYFYSYANLTEWNISLICGTAIISLFVLSVIGYIFSGYFPNLRIFSKLCIYFALFNLIPIGNLDGMKIMMGSFKYWLGLVCLILIGFVIAVILP